MRSSIANSPRWRRRRGPSARCAPMRRRSSRVSVPTTRSFRRRQPASLAASWLAGSMEAGAWPARGMEGSIARLDGLPAHVATVLVDFVGKARDVLADDLVSVVLFGSAAEGRLKATSDVNLILVLRAFEAEKLGQLSDQLLAADAAIQLRVMFLLESEIS